MNKWPEQCRMLRSYKGAPLSIIAALLLRQAALTNHELQIASAWSDKPITDALRLLELDGVVAYHGRLNGWVLTPYWRQLFIGFDGLFDTREAEPGDNLTYLDRNNSDLLLATTTKDLDQKREEVASSSSQIDRKISDLLVLGGVAPDSPKFRELLAANLDPHTVEAHVLERLFQIRRDDSNYGVGLLIYRLLAGDPPPPARCPSCLSVWKHPTYRMCSCGFHRDEEE